MPQSPRGRAAFLACLRVFTHLISAKEMSEVEQDAVLGLIHRVTRFPPAIIATYILMRGKTPHPAQCAALVHCFFESMKSFVPMEIIHGEERRILEASRLLFGFLITKAKQQAGSKNGQTSYISAMKTVDLLNASTNQPILRPVSTSFGLLEEAYFESYREGGILSSVNGQDPPVEDYPDDYSLRTGLLSGACFPEVVSLDIDRLSDGLRRKGNPLVGQKLLDRSLINLESLASLCESGGLSVVAPANLPRSEPPVLTLDRDCFLAVYVGREACGVAGKE